MTSIRSLFVSVCVCLVIASFAFAADAEFPQTITPPSEIPTENQPLALDLKAFEITPTQDTKSYWVEFKERVYDPAPGENTEWYNVPVKVISYGLTKGMYDLPNMITSFFTESVVRSPVDNFLATLDDTVQAFVKLKNGLVDFFSGLLNPTNAAAVDGVFEMADLGFSGAKIGLDIAKTVVSLVGYPVYRVLGGSPSEYAGISSGNRAAIVLIDSGAPFLNLFLDPYGEQIVRYHLKGIVKYYCAVSDVEGDLSECLKKMPTDVTRVDLIALTHTGGTSRIQGVASRIASNTGIKPGLMMSIGCYDSAPQGTEPENSMGVTGLNWAVHFYLSNAIAKRLRGIPMEDAAKQAYYEGIALPNMENPVSLLGMLGVSAMAGSFSEGYGGSYPDVRPMIKGSSK